MTPELRNWKAFRYLICDLANTFKVADKHPVGIVRHRHIKTIEYGKASEKS